MAFPCCLIRATVGPKLSDPKQLAQGTEPPSRPAWQVFRVFALREDTLQSKLAGVAEYRSPSSCMLKQIRTSRASRRRSSPFSSIRSKLQERAAVMPAIADVIKAHHAFAVADHRLAIDDQDRGRSRVGESDTSGRYRAARGIMKTWYTVALSMVAGAALGGAAIQSLHAQAKPKAYSISETEAVDAAAQAAYTPLVRAALNAAGGRSLRTAGGKFVHLEGAASPKRGGNGGACPTLNASSRARRGDCQWQLPSVSLFISPANSSRTLPYGRRHVG
jgi:Domain of unknown function (DUF1330)